MRVRLTINVSTKARLSALIPALITAAISRASVPCFSSIVARTHQSTKEFSPRSAALSLVKIFYLTLVHIFQIER